MRTTHQPVLLQELIEVLDLRPDDTAVDGTLGGGGHTLAIVSHLGKGGTLVGIDLDQDAITHAEKLLQEAAPTVHLVCDSFRNLEEILARLSIEKVNAIAVDLGFSSDQLEQSGRGFSFQRDEPLQMTFKVLPTEEDTTAHDIVNKWDEEHIADILFGFGEEKFARRIAKSIIEARGEHSIETTGELVKLIEEALPEGYRSRKLHPATRTFQALRIAVNDELGALQDVLQKGIAHLVPGGRFAIITFHSIEDRIVKHYFREQEQLGVGSRIHKKPIIPTADEIKQNPRARSAKLRTFQKK